MSLMQRQKRSLSRRTQLISTRIRVQMKSTSMRLRKTNLVMTKRVKPKKLPHKEGSQIVKRTMTVTARSLDPEMSQILTPVTCLRKDTMTKNDLIIMYAWIWITVKWRGGGNSNGHRQTQKTTLLKQESQSFLHPFASAEQVGFWFGCLFVCFGVLVYPFF